MTTLHPSASISALYLGYFDREADMPGFSYWLDRLTNGMTSTQISESFAAQPEFGSVYGTITDYSVFVTQIYDNLFSRAPDAEGLNYWVSSLQSGALTVGNSVNTIIHAAHAGNGVDWAVLNEAIKANSDLGLGRITIADPLLPRAAEITASLQAAWALWEDYIDYATPLDIHISYGGDMPGVLAFAAPQTVVDTGEAASLGWTYWQSGAAHEIITGFDPNGQGNSDGFIGITDLSLAQTQFRASTSEYLQPYNYDGISILAHEIGHVLGVYSRLNADGNQTLPWQWPIFDKYVSGNEADGFFFNGPATVAANAGEPLRLHSGGYPSHAAYDEFINMSPFFGQGEVRLVGAVDVAILADMGVV